MACAMDMWFGAVARIAAAPQHVALANALTELHLDAAALQVAHRDHGAVVRFDQHVVAGQPHPACYCPAALCQGIAHRRQPTEGAMVGLGGLHGDDHSGDRRQNGAAEPGEPLNRFGAQQRTQPDRRCAPGLVHWDEVDRE